MGAEAGGAAMKAALGTDETASQLSRGEMPRDFPIVWRIHKIHSPSDSLTFGVILRLPTV